MRLGPTALGFSVCTQLVQIFAMWSVVLPLVFLPDIILEPVPVPPGCSFSSPYGPKCIACSMYVFTVVEVF